MLQRCAQTAAAAAPWRRLPRLAPISLTWRRLRMRQAYRDIDIARRRKQQKNIAPAAAEKQRRAGKSKRGLFDEKQTTCARRTVA
jgi:hypothetical protein